MGGESDAGGAVVGRIAVVKSRLVGCETQGGVATMHNEGITEGAAALGVVGDVVLAGHGF